MTSPERIFTTQHAFSSKERGFFLSFPLLSLNGHGQDTVARNTQAAIYITFILFRNCIYVH